MIINKLLLKHRNWDIIRDVDFSLWLNLIVDNDLEEKWNNVGKTTLLRCIDYCLWSDGQDIYKDKETKAINQKVYKFLLDIEIHLYVTNSLGDSILLRRNFPSTSKQGVLEIDGINYWTVKKYNERLNEIIYGNITNKPTFRSLAGKFIRLDDFKMANILLFDYPMTSFKKYQLLHSYLFWFSNFQILETQVSLKQDVKILSDQIKSLKAMTGFKNDQVLNQSILIYDKNIADLDEQIKQIKIEWWNIDILDKIQEIRNNIALVSLELSKINTEIAFNQRSKNKLENELKTADKEYIKSIYQQAKIHIPSLQKTFEEVMKFHNSIIVDRLSLVQSSLKDLLDRASVLQQQKASLFQEEVKLLNLVWGKFDNDLEVLREQQKELIEKRWKLTTAQSILKDLNEKIVIKNQHLEKIQPIIDQEMAHLYENIGVFNEFFTSYSKTVCDKDLFLSAWYNDDELLKFEINNLLWNDGTGEKKSQIAAFDFAYADFARKLWINWPKFILHDNIESKDNSHLKNVFFLATQFSWQYILSIIKNRVSSFLSDEDIEKYAIIHLNSQDKFFRLD